MSVYAKNYRVRNTMTPQTEAIPGSKQVSNSAGGYSFQVDKWTRLNRFLILGSEGGSYYASERKLTQENAGCVKECVSEDGLRTVRTIVEVSDGGRAAKNSPAIFALALAATVGNSETQQAAYEALPVVCRTGTHLFEFAEISNGLRGWGRSLRRAIGNWYTSKSVRDLAYQVTKYQQRNGWSHRDLLRLSHPKLEGNYNDVAYYVTKGWDSVGDEPHDVKGLLPIWAAEKAKKASSEKEIVSLIRDYNLVRECIPTQWLNSLDVWDALLENMPLTALVRNLGKMTSIGLVKPLSKASRKVVENLGNAEYIKAARLHPLNILIALRTYSQGHGEKGKLSWSPVTSVVSALDDAFYKSFDYVEPTGKRWLLGIDVSGSMTCSIAGSPISCCEAATAMAMVTAYTEKDYEICAFNTGMQTLPFKRGMSLDAAMKYTRNINYGGTDCSMPMVYATKKKLDVDVFFVQTDSDTYAGLGHPSEHLKRYRKTFGINSKLIVAGYVANNFTIADPNDRGMLDVCGFDTTVPAVVANFANDKF